MRVGLPRSSPMFRKRDQMVPPPGHEAPRVSPGVARSIRFPAPCWWNDYGGEALCQVPVFSSPLQRCNALTNGVPNIGLPMEDCRCDTRRWTSPVGDAVSVPLWEADCFSYR